MKFQLASTFKPTGDQPQAIEKLSSWVEQGKQHSTLLGVTGSGKTFTMANVIEKVQKPTLIISHNKTLAAQLYQEFRDFFPENAVSYFVSYYDYYQPEAYIPTTDTYIEKEATINDEIDKLRLASTTNLLTRPDCIVVASVSCIYNLGSPVEYGKYVLELMEGEVISRETLMMQLVNLQYERSDMELRRGTFRVKGEMMQLWPAYENHALRIMAPGTVIEKLDWIDPLTGKVLDRPLTIRTELATPAAIAAPQNTPKKIVIYPAKHYQTDPETQEQSIKQIEADLDIRLKELRDEGKVVEAYRLEQKVRYDLDMIRELGFVNGIENYSRYFDGRQPGDAPYTLLDYMNYNAKEFGDGSYLTIVDESHMTIPQIRGMYAGDRSRKETLIRYGFRLPSALDNRPLQFPEFLARSKQFLYVSATPEKWEVDQSHGQVAEQLVRPTGLVDPDIEIRSSQGQIPDLVKEILIRKAKGQRTLVTTLTKRMSEVLTEYLNDKKNIQLAIDELWEKGVDINDIEALKQTELKVAYLHSDVETLDRSDILDDLRRGVYDVLVGINLLREGLDLPEVTLVAILDADKAGFLRSKTALIQTMGRAARHSEGHAILYADGKSAAMEAAIEEINRRRDYQQKFNQEHGIVPVTISKPIREQLINRVKEEGPKYRSLTEALGKDKGKKKLGAGSGDQPEFLVELKKGQIVDVNALDGNQMLPEERNKMLRGLNRVMNRAAKDMDFETAAKIRDKIREIEQ